jgi:hypothetical protein
MSRNMVWGNDGKDGVESAEAVRSDGGESGASQSDAGNPAEPNRRVQVKVAGARQFVLLLAAAGVLVAGLVAVGCTGTSSALTPVAPTSSQVSAFALSGTVVAVTTDGQQSLPGAQVEAISDAPDLSQDKHLRRRVTATTDNGLFVLGGLNTGMWTVTINKDGYVPASKRVQVDGDTSVTFELQPVDDGSRLAAIARGR